MSNKEFTDIFAEKLIRKQSETRDYMINHVKSHRGTTAYNDIETAVDNFLRGYNEAIQDAIDILDGLVADEERGNNG